MCWACLKRHSPTGTSDAVTYVALFVELDLVFRETITMNRNKNMAGANPVKSKPSSSSNFAAPSKNVGGNQCAHFWNSGSFSQHANFVLGTFPEYNIVNVTEEGTQLAN